MKIEIIGDGGYNFMYGVKLPIIVEGTPYYAGFLVTTGELRKAGIHIESFRDDYEWCFVHAYAREARKASWFARFNNWLRKL